MSKKTFIGLAPGQDTLKVPLFVTSILTNSEIIFKLMNLSLKKIQFFILKVNTLTNIARRFTKNKTQLK